MTLSCHLTCHGAAGARLALRYAFCQIFSEDMTSPQYRNHGKSSFVPAKHQQSDVSSLMISMARGCNSCFGICETRHVQRDILRLEAEYRDQQKGPRVSDRRMSEQTMNGLVGVSKCGWRKPQVDHRSLIGLVRHYSILGQATQGFPL